MWAVHIPTGCAQGRATRGFRRRVTLGALASTGGFEDVALLLPLARRVPASVRTATAVACVILLAVACAPDREPTASVPAPAASADPSPRPVPDDAEHPATSPAADDDTAVLHARAGSEPPDPPDEAEQQDAGRGRLVIQHVGDVNLDTRYVPILARGELAGAWDGVRDTFDDADLVLVNLECAATAAGTPQDKTYVFRCSLDALPHARDAGVDVANLANNHTGDHGMQGMLDSVANVQAAGMATVGVGHDEDEAYRPHVVEVAGWRVAILGFGGVVPVADWTARGDLPGQATGYDPARMAAAVEAAAADADVVVATVHWGEEGSLEPRPEDVVKAEAMIAAGADVVFGHHAHRLQPLEVIDDVPVFWNLGNFVWQRTSDAAARTAVAQYEIEPDGTVQACLLPFEIDHEGVPRPTGEDRHCAAATALR